MSCAKPRDRAKYCSTAELGSALINHVMLVLGSRTVGMLIIWGEKRCDECRPYDQRHGLDGKPGQCCEAVRRDGLWKHVRQALESEFNFYLHPFLQVGKVGSKDVVRAQGLQIGKQSILVGDDLCPKQTDVVDIHKPDVNVQASSVCGQLNWRLGYVIFPRYSGTLQRITSGMIGGLSGPPAGIPT